MRSIKISAPGKLMLFGEYASLENHPCIVTAVNQRLTINLEKIKTPQFQLNAPVVGLADYKKPMIKLGSGEIPRGAKFVELAIENVVKNHQISFGLKISTSGFSSKYGFGSSACVTVCVIKALSEILNLNLSNKEIFNLSYKTITDVQGKASGFDAAISIYGGTIYFLTGGKKIEELNLRTIPLIVGYSGKKADTVSAIEIVNQRFSDHKDQLHALYNEIEKIVKSAKVAFRKKNYKTLGKLMDKNQEILDKLGVNTKKLNLMISAAREAGAFGAKLSGAGMGDCMIVLCPPKNRELVEALVENAGGEIINIKTNEEGVRVENRY